jgi:hypothetical protein
MGMSLTQKYYKAFFLEIERGKLYKTPILAEKY